MSDWESSGRGFKSCQPDQRITSELVVQHKPERTRIGGALVKHPALVRHRETATNLPRWLDYSLLLIMELIRDAQGKRMERTQCWR